MPGYQWKGTHQGPDLFDATARPAKPQPATPAEPQQLKPCGTDAAYHRHRRRGEEPCDPCRQAKADYAAARRGGRNGRIGNPRVAQCGTLSGATRHYKLGTKPCDACREVANEHKRLWRQQQRAA